MTQCGGWGRAAYSALQLCPLSGLDGGAVQQEGQAARISGAAQQVHWPAKGV